MSDSEKVATSGQERRRRYMEGEVVSAKMEKTVVVQVVRRFKHPRYKKYVQERERYKVHDERNDAKEGDRVEIVECRPMSADKRWRLHQILVRAAQV